MSKDENHMAEEKRAALPALSPRCWHGMTAGVWLPFLRKNRFAASLRHVPMMATISAATVMNSALRVISEAIYAKRAESVELQHPPLFVIGHWRTGTTWMHELLVKDDRFAFPTTYQCMSPHHFLLTDTLFSACLNVLMPKRRPMDNMPVSTYLPQEDEFALMNLGVGSPYLDWAFPNRDRRYTEYLSLQQLSDEDRQQWQHQFKWFLRRMTLKTGKRLVLKSPTHTARISSLLEVFPDARFIHLVRNPLTSIPSTIRTWTRLTDSYSLQVRRDPISEDRILAMFNEMYDQFEKERSLIPPEHIGEVRYEDLVKEPIQTLEQIYQHLELGDFAYARPTMETYLHGIADYKPNRHQIASELKRKIFKHCQSYIEQYGYSEQWNESLTSGD